MDPNKGLWILLAVAIATMLLAPSQRQGEHRAQHPPREMAAAGMPATVTPTSVTAGDGTRPVRHVSPLEPRMVSVSSLDNASERLADTEREFIAAAAALVMYEARIAELALRQATDPAIAEYAAELKANRQGIRDELAAFVETREAPPLPTSLTPEQQRRLDQLAHATGRDFDARFIREATSGQQRGTVKMFESSRRSVSNPTLQAWIDKTLPRLRTQLAQAEALQHPMIARVDGPATLAMR